MSVANVPGFDVLFPSGSYSTTAPSSNASSSSPSDASSTSDTSSAPATDSTSAASTAPNQYEQALDSLTSWEYQYLYEETFGSSDSSGLYATAGLSVDAFANLATELQNLGSTGSTIDTQA